MAFTKLFVITLCCIVGNVVCQGQDVLEQPNVVSFGDFMEFDFGLHQACENVAGGSNTTWGIIVAFQHCTNSIRSDKDMFDNFAAFCQNRDKYLTCWDQMKATVLSKCGNEHAPKLPAVYRASVASLCGNDNGAQKLAELKQAVTEITPSDQAKCPPETGVHWIENCKDLLPLMNSPDICARHTAIDRCLQKITCDNIKFAKLLREVYTNARAELKC